MHTLNQEAKETASNTNLRRLIRMNKATKEFTEYWANERLITVEEQMESQREYEKWEKRANESWFWKTQMPPHFQNNEDAMRFAEAWKKEGLSNAEVIARLEVMQDDWQKEELARTYNIQEEITDMLIEDTKIKVRTFDHHEMSDRD